MASAHKRNTRATATFVRRDDYNGEDIKAALMTSVGARIRKNISAGYQTKPSSAASISSIGDTSFANAPLFRSASDTLFHVRQTYASEYPSYASGLRPMCESMVPLLDRERAGLSLRVETTEGRVRERWADGNETSSRSGSGSTFASSRAKRALEEENESGYDTEATDLAERSENDSHGSQKSATATLTTETGMQVDMDVWVGRGGQTGSSSPSPRPIKPAPTRSLTGRTVQNSSPLSPTQLRPSGMEAERTATTGDAQMDVDKGGADEPWKAIGFGQWFRKDPD